VCDLSSSSVVMDFKPDKNDRRNFSQEATSVVPKMQPQQEFISDQSRMGMVYGSTDASLAYIVFCAPDYPERVAKQLIKKHADAVEGMSGDGTFDSSNPSAAAKKAYAAVCKTLSSEYEGGDKVAAVMREVDQVKGVMSENINQAMSNLESAEDLNTKTDEMKQASSAFNKQAKTAKNQMWWKNMKVRCWCCGGELAHGRHNYALPRGWWLTFLV